MKKILILFIVIAAMASGARAQQLSLYSQYMLNGFLLNPALAGAEDFSPLRLTFRQQWASFKGAPTTQALSFHHGIRNMGIGAYIFNDKFGPVSHTGGVIAYSYSFEIMRIKSRIHLGISISAMQLKVDEGDLILHDEGNDNLITGKTEKFFIPDGNFGVYMTNKKYFAGLAISQLIEYKMKFGGSDSESKNVRHYFLSGGYRFTLSKKFDLEPSAMLKFPELNNLQLDINVKAFYQKNYWLGISYRTGHALVAMLGVKYDIYYIGYAFDFTFNNIRNYSKGSHEILLGVNFGERRAGSTLF